MWRVRFVLSVCSLVTTRENLCVRFLNELLVVRLPFVVKLFILRSWFRSFRVEIFVSLLYSTSRISIFRFELRVQVPWIFVSNFSSNFEFVFWSRVFVSLLYSTSRISLLYSTSRISIFRFELRVQVPWIFVSNFSSNFEFVFWSRVFVSLLYSTSRISLLYSTSRISIFDSSFEFKFLEFSCRISRRNSRFVARFDFSNLDSNLSSKFWFESPIFYCYYQLTSLIYSRTYTHTSLSLPLERCTRFSCVK